MTLQDIVKILSLNPVFKSASDSEKITAINQYLNDMIDFEGLEGGTTLKKFAYQIEAYDTVTFKNLQKTLELDLTPEQIFWLFQFSLIDYSNDNPYPTSFRVLNVTDNIGVPYTINIAYATSTKAKQTKKQFIYNIISRVKSAFQPKSFKEVTYGLNSNITLSNQPKQIYSNIFSLNKSVSYSTFDWYRTVEYTLDYSVTYNIWE